MPKDNIDAGTHVWGTGGPEFKSRRSDQIICINSNTYTAQSVLMEMGKTGNKGAFRVIRGE
jgi:hypothetical protein